MIIKLDRNPKEVRELLKDTKERLTKLNNIFSEYPEYDFSESIALLTTLLGSKIEEERPSV